MKINRRKKNSAPFLSKLMGIEIFFPIFAKSGLKPFFSAGKFSVLLQNKINLGLSVASAGKLMMRLVRLNQV